MSDTTSGEKVAVNAIRTAFGIGGAIALIVGILILFAPLKAAAVGTAIIAVYAIASGIIYAGIGVFSKKLGGWSRVGHIVLGILFIVAGVVAFSDLSSTTVFLAMFVAIFIGVSWIVEGVVSLTTLADSSSKGLTVLFAVISIIAGLYLVFAPLLGAAVLWWVLGIMMIVLGVFQIVRAFTFKTL